jgi:hypothetical protein
MEDFEDFEDFEFTKERIREIDIRNAHHIFKEVDDND